MDFFSVDEKLNLEGQAFLRPSANTRMARLFDRYKDKTVHLYVRKKRENSLKNNFAD